MNGNRRIAFVVVIAALMVSISLGFFVHNSLEGREDTAEAETDLIPLKQQLGTLTHSHLSSMDGSSSLATIEEDLESQARTWISSGRVILEDNVITVIDSKVDISETNLSLDIPLPPGNMIGETETLVQNSMLYGSSGAVPILPLIRARTELLLLLEPTGEGESIERKIVYETEVLDPQRGLVELIKLIEKDMNGWGSGMARDMEYMLTTLARTRTTNDWGSEPLHSDLNVLGEGDVEIAFNIALALRICRWTGQIPVDLVNDIDRFFLDQIITPETNPTGLRIWGEAEKENYHEIWRRSGTQLRRYLPDLLSSALSAGHGDPADIFARYLFLEKWAGNKDLDMLDMDSTLEDMNLVSEREPANNDDPFSIEHHTSFPDPEGIPISPRQGYESDANITLHRFKPMIEPVNGYMIIGRDIMLEGMESPLSWFSDANPDLDPSELVAIGGLPVRCGAIPPPQQPPGHNFRIQWDLGLSGTIDLTGESRGFGGNVIDQGPVWRELSFDFPIRIYTWFDQRPSNDGFDFKNINTGRLYWNEMMTGWSITPESNATEVFEEHLFGELREGLEMITSQLRSMEWYLQMEMLDPLELRKVFQTKSLTTMSLLEKWSENWRIWTNLNRFFIGNVTEKGIQVEDLGTVKVEGHMFRMSYSDIKDRLDLVSKLPEGQIRLSLFGPVSGDNRIEIGIETSTGIRVDLRPDTMDFAIKGEIMGRYIDDGPLDPDAPSSDVSDLVIRSGWVVSGPSFEINTWTTSGKYIETDGSLNPNGISLSFFFAGEKEKDQREIVLEASDLFYSDMQIGESTLSARLYDMGIFATDKDIWFGVSVHQEGSDRSHPSVRKLMLKIKDIGDLEETIQKGSMVEMVRSLIWGITSSENPLQDMGIEYNMILLEYLPSWISSMDVDVKQLLFSTSRSVEIEDGITTVNEGINLFYYGEDKAPYSIHQEGWRSETIEMPVSLW